MTTVRTLIEAVVQFFGEALRPVRRVRGVAQEFGIGIVGAAGVLAIWRSFGGLWAAFTVVAVFALLFLVEGWRREYQRRAVKFSVTDNAEEPIGDLDHDPAAFMQYTVMVRNEGADGHFNAAVVSDVKGAMNAGYGHFECAWEGTAEVEPAIRPDRVKYVIVGKYHPARSGFQFIVPPSPRTGGIKYGEGPVQLFKTSNWRLEFDLEVRHVETGVAQRRTVRVRFDPVGAHCPLMEFV
jgi:hypothetical protein